MARQINVGLTNSVGTFINKVNLDATYQGDLDNLDSSFGSDSDGNGNQSDASIVDALNYLETRADGLEKELSNPSTETLVVTDSATIEFLNGDSAHFNKLDVDFLDSLDSGFFRNLSGRNLSVDSASIKYLEVGDMDLDSADIIIISGDRLYYDSAEIKDRLLISDELQISGGTISNIKDFVIDGIGDVNLQANRNGTNTFSQGHIVFKNEATFPGVGQYDGALTWRNGKPHGIMKYRMFSSATEFTMQHHDSGDWHMIKNTDNIIIRNTSNDKTANFGQDSSNVELWQGQGINNGIRLKTVADGIEVYNDVLFPDSGRARFGADDNLEIYHDPNTGENLIKSSGDITFDAGTVSFPRGTSIGSVQTISGSAIVTPGEFITSVYHSGTGTVSVRDSGWEEGSLINIATGGTLTMDWFGGSGISLGNSCKIASGMFRNGVWYFSETVY